MAFPHPCAVCGKPVRADDYKHVRISYDNRFIVTHLNCKEANMAQPNQHTILDDMLSSAEYVSRKMRAQMVLDSGRPFFILFNPGSERPSKVIFEDQQEAFRIAEMMARKNPDERFYVMQSVGFSQTQQPVATTMLLKELSASAAPVKKAASRSRKR